MTDCSWKKCRLPLRGVSSHFGNWKCILFYSNQCFGLKYLSGTSKGEGREGSISGKEKGGGGVDLLGGSRLKSSISIGDRPLVLGSPMRRGCCWTSKERRVRPRTRDNIDRRIYMYYSPPPVFLGPSHIINYHLTPSLHLHSTPIHLYSPIPVYLPCGLSQEHKRAQEESLFPQFLCPHGPRELRAVPVLFYLLQRTTAGCTFWGEAFVLDSGS